MNTNYQPLKYLIYDIITICSKLLYNTNYNFTLLPTIG